MLGLLVIIVISWGLLYLFEKKNIDVLGVIPNKKRSIQFFIGFMVITIICLTTICIKTLIFKVDWRLNNNINYSVIFNSFVYHIKSALTEDLVFRGAILYILIQRIGVKKALVISAFLFGVYHIFSYGLIGGNIIQMVYITLTTGLIGYVWAYTFYKTKSIMMGLGFHLGFNFLMSLFYKNNPYGNLVFQEISKINLVDWNWLFYNIAKDLFTVILTFIFVNYYLKHSPKLNLKKSLIN